MAERRTWSHQGRDAWRPVFVVRAACGCWTDFSSGVMWEPCMAHESEGHLSVISEQDGMWVARCLAGICDWRSDNFVEGQALASARDHWIETAEPQVKGQ